MQWKMAKSLEISILKQLFPNFNLMALVNDSITGKVLENQN